MSAVQIAEHAHCEICGRVVKVGTRWCGEECEAKHDEAQKYKKRQMWLFLALIVGTLILVRLPISPF